jgi:hypothetical protein
VNTRQFRYALALSVLAVATGLWLWSYAVCPGKGFLRTALYLGLWLLLLRHYVEDFRAIGNERPFDQSVLQWMIVVWLFVMLGVLLVAQSNGHVFPANRGIDRPLFYALFIFPFLCLSGIRCFQLYFYLGRKDA